MQLIDKYEIRRIFINLTNTRGLLWPDIVEGILFDKNGFPRTTTIDVKIDNKSLVNKMKLNSKEEVVNYILVIDYLIDYLKNKYDLIDIKITTLLKEYLTQCNISNFKILKGEIGSWIIPSNLIIKENTSIFETTLTEIVIWLVNKHLKPWNKEHLYIKQELSNKNINNIIFTFLENINKNNVKELLSPQDTNNNELWNKTIKELKEFIDEKKNSKTSS